MTELKPIAAIEQLTMHQQQLDMDGVFVGVSRQALDELLAYVTRADGWQDIADAPRDGTHILLAWSHKNGTPPRVSECFWRIDMPFSGKGIWWCFHGRLFAEPTHFMHLPTPPGGDHG